MSSCRTGDVVEKRYSRAPGGRDRRWPPHGAGCLRQGRDSWFVTLANRRFVFPEPLDVVVTQHEVVEKTAAGLGNLPPAPFSILSFLALSVIPELRLTDLGLVDVKNFKLLKWN